MDHSRTASASKPLHPIEFIVLMACIMLLTALAIDIMLPAFNDVRQHFGLSPDSTATAQIVTFFFLGQIGQIVYGPLSDRFGRLVVLRLGFALYIIGCIAAALLPSLEGIYAARFVVGMGAAALSVSTTTSVRDRFTGAMMARTMSLIMTIFLFVPVIAPVLGSVILSLTSWQGVFLTPAIAAAAIFVWSLRLGESLPPERRLKLDLPTVVRSTRQVMGNSAFVRYTLVTTILFAPFSSYVSSSERMISGIYGHPELFVGIFAFVGITMALFTFLNAQFVGQFGVQRTVRTLLAAYLVAAVVLLGLTLAGGGIPNIFLFFGIVALLQGINVAVSPNSSTLALESLGSTVGMAAAINGTAFFVVGSLLGSLIDRLLVESVTALAMGYGAAGVIVVLLAFWPRAEEKTA